MTAFGRHSTTCETLAANPLTPARGGEGLQGATDHPDTLPPQLAPELAQVLAMEVARPVRLPLWLQRRLGGPVRRRLRLAPGKRRG